MVFKMKNIVKAGIAVLLALGVIIAVALSFVGGDKVYNAGSYSAYIILQGKPVEVCVGVSSSRIETIELKGVEDEVAVFYPTIQSCFDEVSNSIIEAQSTELDSEGEYAVAERVITAAVDKALEKAKR
jgi:uncharacterized protein with FMN-binding domain